MAVNLWWPGAGWQAVGVVSGLRAQRALVILCSCLLRIAEFFPTTRLCVTSVLQTAWKQLAARLPSQTSVAVGRQALWVVRKLGTESVNGGERGLKAPRSAEHTSLDAFWKLSCWASDVGGGVWWRVLRMPAFQRHHYDRWVRPTAGSAGEVRAERRKRADRCRWCAAGSGAGGSKLLAR